MGIWGLKWLRFFLIQYEEDEFAEKSEEERREHILRRLEDAPFTDWAWIVVVAGMGFLTDAYAIFSINMVIPMLGIVYFNGALPHTYEVALSVVTLGGTIVGQIGFGLAADICGRRKMYGLELIITIGASLGVVMSSNGINGSLSIIVWLLIWRFFLGIGIGADYPLSAVICSEFAPTAMRGKMLTLVFLCQPLGQLAATLVALIAAARQRDGLPPDATFTNCTGVCMETLDSIWRWVIGVGVIPAFIALWFRLTIIESPRYTADVGRDSRKAMAQLSHYQGQAAAPGSETVSTTVIDISPRGHKPVNEKFPGSTSIEMAEVKLQGETAHLKLPAMMSSVTGHLSSSEGGISENQRELPAMMSGGTGHPSSLSGGIFENQREHTVEYQPPPAPSWEDFKDYFWYKGHLKTLMATSICWFCVDLPFYGLGMSSPRILSTIWYGKGPQPVQVYDVIVHNVWQSLVTVSIGSILGCVITFLAIDKLGRRKIQLLGFLYLFIIYIIIGATFNHLYETGQTSAVIVLYVLCQAAYNFGPNTTTYIMPAELFPTRYRGLCHGISAAFGKLGSVVAQLFLAYINYGNGRNYTAIEFWLPFSVLIFSAFMLVGFFTTIYWLPRDEYALDSKTNTKKVKTLEQWEVGRDSETFSATPLARFIAAAYHRLAKAWDVVYMWLDKISGGEVAQQRQYQEIMATRAAEEMERNRRREEAAAEEEEMNRRREEAAAGEEEMNRRREAEEEERKRRREADEAEGEEIRQLAAAEEVEAREREAAEIRRLEAEGVGKSLRRSVQLDEEVGPHDEAR